MSRNRIEANTRVFNKFDEFCKARGLLLDTHGCARWIATKSHDRHVLDQLKLLEVAAVGGGRHLCHGRLDDSDYLISSGFELSEAPVGFEEYEAGPGHLTAIISEIPIPITASPYEIKDIVDLHDKSTAGYAGHDHTQIAKLFPKIRIHNVGASLENPWSIFFKLCLDERSRGIDAINIDLRDALAALAELDPHLLPYRVLCRSIFDGDPSSFFLALYRCFESLYSYASARELGRRFSLEKSWQEIASTVENVTGWYPREESSLETLLRMASKADLDRLVTAAGDKVVDGQTPSAKAAKVIYSIRNSVVHYRPAQQQKELDDLDWPNICTHMVGLILDVYAEAGQPN